MSDGAGGHSGGGEPAPAHGGGGAPAGATGEDAATPHGAAGHGAHHGDNQHGHNGDGTYDFERKPTVPMASRRNTSTPNPFSRKNTSIDLDDYFVRQQKRVRDNLHVPPR
jgi:hypothetical protein